MLGRGDRKTDGILLVRRSQVHEHHVKCGLCSFSYSHSLWPEGVHEKTQGCASCGRDENGVQNSIAHLRLGVRWHVLTGRGKQENSDSQADVLLQATEIIDVATDCPRNVRVSKAQCANCDAMNDALARLCSIRHHCFVRGVLGKNPDPDFRQAFRTMNRLYVEVKREALKGQSDVSKRPSERRKRAA
jgi:hypothetical protein